MVYGGVEVEFVDGDVVGVFVEERGCEEVIWCCGYLFWGFDDEGEWGVVNVVFECWGGLGCGGVEKEIGEFWGFFEGGICGYDEVCVGECCEGGWECGGGESVGVRWWGDGGGWCGIFVFEGVEESGVLYW